LKKVFQSRWWSEGVFAAVVVVFARAAEGEELAVDAERREMWV
jgi:hypothetical protein